MTFGPAMERGLHQWAPTPFEPAVPADQLSALRSYFPDLADAEVSDLTLDRVELEARLRVEGKWVRGVHGKEVFVGLVLSLVHAQGSCTRLATQ
jgi:hypothetical protein